MNQRNSGDWLARLAKMTSAVLTIGLAGCASTSSPPAGDRYKGDSVWNIAAAPETTFEEGHQSVDRSLS